MSLALGIDEQVAFTKAILLRCVVENTTRLANGSKLRDVMFEEYKKGLRHVENNYRYVWLKASIRKVDDLLGNVALDFNVQHADDMASIQDMIDILTSALANLKKRQ